MPWTWEYLSRRWKNQSQSTIRLPRRRPRILMEGRSQRTLATNPRTKLLARRVQENSSKVGELRCRQWHGNPCPPPSRQTCIRINWTCLVCCAREEWSQVWRLDRCERQRQSPLSSRGSVELSLQSHHSHSAHFTCAPAPNVMMNGFSSRCVTEKTRDTERGPYHPK